MRETRRAAGHSIGSVQVCRPINDWMRMLLMKKLLVLLFSGLLPLVSAAGEYQSTLLVQTGQMRESDLVVRTVTDLASKKICLTFYVRTVGTSPSMTCYDAETSFKSQLNQVGHFKEEELVVRKLKDSENNVSCLVAYTSAKGTSPAIDCYKNPTRGSDAIVRNGHLREGDLDVNRIVDAGSNKTCVIAYVKTGGTAPSLACYTSKIPASGGMIQESFMREGDLVARKIVDQANHMACLITYVSTEGTSPNIYCFPG